MSSHYLVKHKSTNFVYNMYILAIRVLRFCSSSRVSKWMGHTIATTFLPSAQKLLPDIRRISQGGSLVFQQDGVSAHRARVIVSFLERETPIFIPPTLWLPNSPDLNPVDYSIWGVLQEKVYRSRIANVDELIEEWSRFDQSIVDAAIGQSRRRLSAWVHARRAHFEHQL